MMHHVYALNCTCTPGSRYRWCTLYTTIAIRVKTGVYREVWNCTIRGLKTPATLTSWCGPRHSGKTTSAAISERNGRSPRDASSESTPAPRVILVELEHNYITTAVEVNSYIISICALVLGYHVYLIQKRARASRTLLILSLALEKNVITIPFTIWRCAAFIPIVYSYTIHRYKGDPQVSVDSNDSKHERCHQSNLNTVLHKIWPPLRM